VLPEAAALETHSAHVHAQAIVDGTADRSLELPAAENVSEVITIGPRGLLDGAEVAAGKLVSVARDARQPWGAPAAGETGVYVSCEGTLLGRVVLSDQVRPEAAETVTRMHGLGVVRTLMLSGNAHDTAKEVTKGVGIDDVRGELMPIGKVDAMRSMQPRPAMMVGDGVDDAPVLAAADVRVAMGARGAAATSESADVVVLIDHLDRVPGGRVNHPANHQDHLPEHWDRTPYRSIILGPGGHV
jgi:P-type E1-E2 ATPase